MITIVKRNFLIPYKVKVSLNITTVVVYVSDLHISRRTNALCRSVLCYTYLTAGPGEEGGQGGHLRTL